MARNARPHVEYRKLLRDVCEELDLDYDHLKFRWSQKAGCSCPCSPGFIISGNSGSNYHITVSSEGE